MNKAYSLITLFLLTLMIFSCGNSNPAISHIVVKSDRLGILLDTKDSELLSKIQPIFYEKEKSPEAGPDFRYFIDITIDNKTERWQYSDQGYIRNYDEGFAMIYKFRDVTEFNRIAKIR